MHFEKLDLNDNAQREFFERVYNDAFPARERRPLKYLYRNYTEKDKPFTLWLIWDDGRMVGLVGAWEFPGLVYGEYFAVDQTRRGQGLGQRALALWLSHLPAPALIEVEPPVDPLTGLDDPVARRQRAAHIARMQQFYFLSQRFYLLLFPARNRYKPCGTVQVRVL